MGPIKKKYMVNAPLEEVWEALTDPDKISDWSGAGAKMSNKMGEKFSLWDGDVIGTNKNIVDKKGEKTLTQEWYYKHWEKPSLATFDLKEKEGKTELTLTHSGVLEDEREDIDKGWDDYYLRPLKELVEN